MSRKTEANKPADWRWICEQDLPVLRLALEREMSFYSSRGKLAEVLEKALKAELIRLGWPLEKTHDLQRLRDPLVARDSDLGAAVKPLCDGLAEAYMVVRYPGFDLDDPDWPTLRQQFEAVGKLIDVVRARVVPAPPTDAKHRAQYKQNQAVEAPRPHPLFQVCAGEVASWERTQAPPRAASGGRNQACRELPSGRSADRRK